MEQIVVVSIGELISRGVLEMSDGYRTKRTELGSPGFRIIRVADVANGEIRLESPDFVSSKFEKSVGKKIGQAGDILLTTKGTVGRVAVMPLVSEPVVYSPQICFFRVLNHEAINSSFLKFWFSSPEFLAQASDRMNNTDMAAYINLTDIRSLRLSLPSTSSQTAIAEVLGALDDKIAANTKLAVSIDEFLAAKFAEALQNGHEIVEFGEIASVNSNTVRPAPGTSLRYLDIAGLGVGSHEWPELSPWDTAPSRARRGISSGDTIWSTVRPNRRSHSLVLSEDSSLVGSTGLAVLSPKEVGFAYLYELTKRDEFTAYLENVAEGSAYPAVRASFFTQAPVPLLGAVERASFEQFATPMRKQQHLLGMENATLAETRDTLLPQLMSGKLRVKDAQAGLDTVV